MGRRLLVYVGVVVAPWAVLLAAVWAVVGAIGRAF